jgi:hypothetical protein
MDCKQAELSLIDFLYGELAAAEREAFERHLQACPEHAAEVARMRAVLKLVRDDVREEPSAAVNVRILQAARAAASQVAAPSPWWRWLLSPAAVAAVLALVLVTVGVGVYFSQQNKEPAVARVPSTATEPVVIAEAKPAAPSAPPKERFKEEKEAGLKVAREEGAVTVGSVRPDRGGEPSKDDWQTPSSLGTKDKARGPVAAKTAPAPAKKPAPEETRKLGKGMLDFDDDGKATRAGASTAAEPSGQAPGALPEEAPIGGTAGMLAATGTQSADQSSREEDQKQTTAKKAKADGSGRFAVPPPAAPSPPRTRTEPGPYPGAAGAPSSAPPQDTAGDSERRFAQPPPPATAEVAQAAAADKKAEAKDIRPTAAQDRVQGEEEGAAGAPKAGDRQETEKAKEQAQQPPLADREIGETIKTRLQDFKRCVDQSAQRDAPGLTGTMNMEITIGPDGSVSRTSTTTPAFQGSTLVECFSRVIKSLKFRAAGGKPKTFSFPFSIR